jgi:hypothetical protein
MPRLGHADLHGNGGAPVTALRVVALVAQTRHERAPRAADALQGPARRGRLAGKAEARQRRADEMEGVARLSAVGRGIGQRTHDFQELDDRAGPAMRHDQRHRLWVRRAHMHELDVQPIQCGDEVRIRVELCFTTPPVVALAPVGADFLRIGERDALAPIGRRLAFRPTRVPQACVQIIELDGRNVECERAYCCTHGPSLLPPC